VAGIIQRSTVALRFSTCAASGSAASRISKASPPRGQDMAVNENPTRLSFGGVTGSMFRGASLGNTALLAAVCLLVAPLAALYRRCAKPSAHGAPTTMGSALARLRLPGRVFVVYSVLLQPTATAAAGLLMLALSPGDVAIAATVAVLWLAVLGWFVRAVHRGCSRLVTHDGAFTTHEGPMDMILGGQSEWLPRAHLTDHGSNDQEKWVTSESYEGAEQFVEQFSVLIARARGGSAWREQYFCFGCLWSVVSGAVGALDPSDPPSCDAARIALVAVAALSLISLVAVRPYASLFMLGFQIVLELLSLVTAVLLLVDAGEDSAQSISYAQISISGAVSLMRGANRVLLWFSERHKRRSIKRAKELASRARAQRLQHKQLHALIKRITLQRQAQQRGV
jgi:hypothetical protein